MRITIIIEETGQGLAVSSTRSPGGRSDDRRTDTTDKASEAASRSSEDPSDGTSKDGGDLQSQASELLVELKVDHRDRLLKQFQPARIVEVCQAAIRKRDKLSNPAGYVLRALRQGWAV